MRFDYEYGAAFYLPPPDDPEPPSWLDRCLARIGVTAVERAASQVLDTERVSGTWSGFVVDVKDLDLGYFRAVELTFSAREFDRLRRERGREFEDAFVADFRDACTRVEASAAFATTITYPDLDALVAEVGGDVLARDLHRLLRDRELGLLYLSEAWFEEYDLLVHASDPNREQVPVAGGRMLFAYSGPHRW